MPRLVLLTALRRRFGALITAVTFTFSTLAGAAETPEEPSATGALQLSWAAPHGCPDADYVRRAVARHLGPAVGGAVSHVSARGEIHEQIGGSYRLELHIEGPGGADARSLEATDCKSLADALAFSLALILDPSLSDVVQRAAPPPPTQPVAPRTQTPRRPAIHGRIAAGGGVDYGALPGVAGDAAIDLFVAGRHWRVGATGRYGAPRSVPSVELGSAGATFQLGAAGVLGCGVMVTKWVEIPGCGGVEAGAIRADGFGLMGNRTVHRLWLAGVLASGLEVRLSRSWESFIRIEAVFPMLRPGFTVDGGSSFATVGSAGLRGLIGLQARFGGDLQRR